MIVRVVVALREDAVVGGEIAQTAVSAFLRMPCNIKCFLCFGLRKIRTVCRPHIFLADL